MKKKVLLACCILFVMSLGGNWFQHQHARALEAKIKTAALQTAASDQQIDSLTALVKNIEALLKSKL